MITPDYAKLADALAADIAAGRLKPGDRLPPQRSFAYERGIAVSTASRVYGELYRRGLVVGEVGRGTFIAGNALLAETRRPDPPSLSSEPAGRIDLEVNFPMLADQGEAIARSLQPLMTGEGLTDALRAAPFAGTAAVRAAASRGLSRGGWTPSPDSFLFTGAGRQAIGAALSALVPIGGRIGVEAVTYPQIKSLAVRLGATLVPLAMDEEGVRPDAIAKAHRDSPLQALYIQPALHNPLGTTFSPARREAIAELAERLDLTLIEDWIYGFLCDDPPLAALIPHRSIVVDSLSKRIAPGLGLGFLNAPAHLHEALKAGIRAGGWSATGLGLAAGQRLFEDGTAAALALRKREDAVRRQSLAARCFKSFDLAADPRAYHLWLTLPDRWRSEAFAAAASRQGIALSPSSAFTVGQGHAPNAVRLALASPSLPQLERALETLAGLLRSEPEAFQVTE